MAGAEEIGGPAGGIEDFLDGGRPLLSGNARAAGAMTPAR
jgi:hypothetical protein